MSFAKAWWLCLGTWWQRVRRRPDRSPEIPSGERRWDLDAVELAAYYQIISPRHGAEDRVEERSWADLEMSRVFARLDDAATPLGSQYLYALLRIYQTDVECLKENARACQLFDENPAERAALRKVLHPLGHNQSADLAALLFGPELELPRFYRLFFLLAVVSLLCTAGVFLNLWLLWPLIALWLTNIGLSWRFGRDLRRHTPALRSLALLLGAVPDTHQVLRAIDLPEVERLKAVAGEAKALRKRISLGFLRNLEGNDLAVAVMEYSNLLCLFELCFCCRALAGIRSHRDTLRTIFSSIARVDAFQGLSESLAGFPRRCEPQFVPGRSFSFDDVCHPLVAASVGNTLSCTGRSLLLSGTNMSGKTTFMKTLGTNLILAQTVGFCFARRAVIPPARIFTVIQRRESTDGGQSYFLREARELLEMMRGAERANGRSFWFLIDEPFRGTNSAERIAAGCAVLGYLNRRWLAIASTHDLELAAVLADPFDCYHFTEVIEGDEARFDYKLRAGTCQSRNAIRMLVIAGYPSDVTDYARSVAEAIKTSPWPASSLSAPPLD